MTRSGASLDEELGELCNAAALQRTASLERTGGASPALNELDACGILERTASLEHGGGEAALPFSSSRPAGWLADLLSSNF